MINLNIVLITALMTILVALLTNSNQALAGGNRGSKGKDIILYKNNLLIRGGKKGKGGNLLIASNQHHHYHEHGGHGESEFGHKMMAEVIGAESKGNNKGRNRITAGGQMKAKGGGMTWEKMILNGGH